MPIELKVLTEQYFQSSFELATEVFARNSSLHKALHIGLKEYREYLLPSFEDMLKEGLSVVATDTANDEVMGCLIACDFHRHLETVPGADDRFASLAALTNALCRQYLKVRSIGVGQAVLIDMGAVSPVAAGKGIYQKMRNKAQNLSKTAGFQLVVGELSSASSQHVVLRKLGHKKRAEIAFADFEYNGSFPFGSISDPRTIVLAEGKL